MPIRRIDGNKMLALTTTLAHARGAVPLDDLLTEWKCWPERRKPWTYREKVKAAARHVQKEIDSQ